MNDRAETIGLIADLCQRAIFEGNVRGYQAQVVHTGEVILNDEA